MKKNKQVIFDKGNGDCMRASLTSILDLPNDPKKIPLSGAADWWKTAPKFLRKFGLVLRYDEKAFWKQGYWMASVKSLNFEGGSHAIVMRGTRVAHDPSTKKRYKTGEDMLQGGAVQGGYVLEVAHPLKLHKLAFFRNKILSL
jgi:hypothetical protein